MRKPLLFITLIAAFLLSGCASAVKIGRIKADPTRFRDKTVKVDGRVTNSFGAMVAGFYEIEDETGKIYVISRGGVPSSGARVKVKGNVLNAFTFMGKSLGTAIQEKSHNVK